MRRLALSLTALLAASAVAGCAIDSAAVGGILGRPLAADTVAVDGRAAARAISAYRASRGLPPVTVDQRLTQIAADHARLMARANRVAHVLPGEGSFSRRIDAGGFEASVAAENIGAGYESLAAALEGWQRSPAHDANLLKPEVTLIGIAASTAPESTYGTYWSLVLAAPYTPPPSGLSAGPFVPIAR